MNWFRKIRQGEILGAVFNWLWPTSTSRRPASVEVSSIEIREAISGSVDIIVDTVKDALDDTPPELIADLMESGICMAGGTSQLKA